MRVLVATSGSTGDLAPFLPIVAALESLGHECRLAVPRFLGLHLRRLNVAHFTFGSATGAATLKDDRLITNRFSGWESWRRVIVDHMAPDLNPELADVGKIFDEWSPDVVASSALVVAPRIVAHARGIPHAGLSLYPQFQDLEHGEGRSFARQYVHAVAVAMHNVVDNELVREIAWGQTDRGAILHDPAFVDRPSLSPVAQPIGFPYWDAFPHSAETFSKIEEWIATRRRPLVLVTLGSFVRRSATFDHIVESLGSVAVDVLILSALREECNDHSFATGFVPLSRVASRCAAVVHHGGIGTTYGVLRCGVPSVIVPQAFDQQYNADHVERAGIGRSTTLTDLATAVRSVLDDGAMLDTTARVAGSLIPTDDVVRRACALIRSAV